MPHQFKKSHEIEGLDEPMIAAWLIPEGCVQDYDTSARRWRVRKKGERTYLPYFPVINFEKDGHPDMLL